VPGDPLIEGRALIKRFGAFRAVDEIDFRVEPGETFGFLGPNGAGKTSTMRMIGCVSPVTEGQLRILGMDPATDGPRIRARLGVVPQEDNLDTELTVWDNMLIYGRYFGLKLSEIRPIARALINQPDLLLLDEPTTGLDPQARHLVWERLWQLKRQGVTLVLTTHYMDEAEQLCDRLVIMDQGRIVAEGSPRQLITQYSTRSVVELRFHTTEEAAAAYPKVEHVSDRVEVVSGRILIYTEDGDAIAAHVESNGVEPSSVFVRRGTLEDVFLTLAGRTLED
jgi:lipooligosaccharide transport system ATP-binding protein